jgi:hypothetical protein
MRLTAVAALLASLCATSACTTTQVSGIDESVTTYAIGKVSGSYGSDLAADRVQRAEQHRIVESIGEHVERWMREAGTWDGLDELHVSVDRFRLPNKARWMSGQAKGNDYLGAEVFLIREGEEPAQHFHVEHTIGTGDRSIAENYSANRALENLIEHVAWSIVLEVTPMDERMPVYAIGKREQIERAIEELEICGQLSYAALLKYSALGKASIGLAAGAEARRVKWMFSDPDPCWTGGGDLDEAESQD